MLLPPTWFQLKPNMDDRIIHYGFLVSYLALSVMRFCAATVFVFVGFVAAQLIYYSLAPMSWWVDYTNIEILPTPMGQEELIRIHRSVPPERGIVVVRRLTEVQEETPQGMRQYCLNVLETAASSASNPSILSGLQDYVGERCAKMVFPGLEGHTVKLQILYQAIIPPYSIGKTKTFIIGPFVIRNGILQVPDTL